MYRFRFKKQWTVKKSCESAISNFFLRRNCSVDQTSKVLDQGYVPKNIEHLSLEEGYFDGQKTSEKPFSLILPPPNITGNLHLGHALTVTIQDVLVRWNRMRGTETLWIPGIDHAGIATQVVVEKKLWKERQLTRHNLGREAFEAEIWKWKQQKEQKIGQQLRRLGASLDWSKQMFTMDPAQSKAVTEAFIKLYQAGLIYRADYLVNWSCVLQSAISDIEVEHREIKGPTSIAVPGYQKPVEFGVLTKFAYKFQDSEDEEIIVATTRPETMLGDVAVAVHPKDPRYSSFIGRNLWHPFRKEPIPIICDDFVDPEFGTGAVKLTPAHDYKDFEVGKRRGLKLLNIINAQGLLSPNCGKFSGLKRFDARSAVVAELDNLHLLRGRQDHDMIVPICSRSKDVVEFLVKPQWFLKCQEMAQKAVDDVRSGRLLIQPQQFEKTWFNWLENIRDWCISRQLWWGHRIPAYSCYGEGDKDRMCWVAAEDSEVARSKAAQLLSIPRDNVITTQDEDVLDTWFSSALLPFSGLGWPQQTEDLAKYYPLSIMETGHDILFFWVARMVMLGNQLTGQLPFNKILMHGIVCDSQGRKMSKSLGNVIAPEEIIDGSSLKELEETSKSSHASGILSEEELKRAIQGQKRMFPEGIPECGADALRFTLCSHNIKSTFINFDVQECRVNKFFGNKIWQATKFTNKWMEAVSQAQNLKPTPIILDQLTMMDKWILSRLSHMAGALNESLENSDFHIATAAIKNFFYYEFCDVYLETTKRQLQKIDSAAASNHCFVLTACLDSGLRLLSPFMPRLAQHLHERLQLHPAVNRDRRFPQKLEFRNEGLERDVEIILETVVSIRRLKKLFNVSGKHKPEVLLVSQCFTDTEILPVVEDLTGCHRASFALEDDNRISDRNFVSDKINNFGSVHLYVPEESMKQFEVDLQRMEGKVGKLNKELEKIRTKAATEDYRLKASEKSKEHDLKKMTDLKEKIARINYLQSFTRNKNVRF